MDFEVLKAIARETGLRAERRYSVPFPHQFGRHFMYKEFGLVANIDRVSELP